MKTGTDVVALLVLRPASFRAAVLFLVAADWKMPLVNLDMRLLDAIGI
jgi:hypothetical protein